MGIRSVEKGLFANKGIIKMIAREYIKLSELAGIVSMSPKTLKKHLDEITHYRATPRSPILVRMKDFDAWMERRRRDSQEDPDVHTILTRIAEVV